MPAADTTEQRPESGVNSLPQQHPLREVDGKEEGAFWNQSGAPLTRF